MTPISYPWDTFPLPGDAVQVADGVLWMRLPLPMALDHVNVYALDDGEGWTIVDTGFNSRKTKAIWRRLLDGPLAGKPVKRVFVTHHHPDHVGLAGWFQTEFGAELVMTRTAWLLTRMLTLDEDAAPKPENLAYWHRAGMSDDIMDQRKGEKPFNYADAVAPLPYGFTSMAQGQVIRAGGRDWDIHIGHGHAECHATFWSRDDNLILSGDQILPSISPNIGVYASEPEADPLADWLESCERLNELARADHLALCGHKLPFTGVPLRLKHLIENHHSALARLETYLSTPRTACDCFSVLFKRPIGPDNYGLALVEAVAHWPAFVPCWPRPPDSVGHRTIPVSAGIIGYMRTGLSCRGNAAL